MQLRAPLVASLASLQVVLVAGCGGGGGSGAPACVPQVEACNGRDDDCDGVADEELGTVACGVGACSATVPACTGGVPGTCTPGLPQAESCNGLDDNCDGVVDEGCVCTAGQSQACYTGPPGTVGVGQCAAGSQQCESGHWAACLGDLVPAPETCNGLDDDCDGQVDQPLTPPPNDNQLGACAGTVKSCAGAGGWVSDYSAVPGYGQMETPDASFADENCDGIDGDVASAVFVAPTGSDVGDCPMASPCRTIGFALAAAQAAGKPHAYLRYGNHAGPVALVDGVSLFGAYGADWSRATTNVVTLTGGLSAGGAYLSVHASGVNALLADLTVMGPNASGTTAGGQGRSSYAVHAASSNLTLRRVILIQGNGSSGANGSPATPAPQSTYPGAAGGDAAQYLVTCDDTSRGAGGAGGVNSCGAVATNGGSGGAGGTMDELCTGSVLTSKYTALPGTAGSTGQGPGGPTAPGAAGATCSVGQDGTNGVSGTPGAGGMGGSGSGFLSGTYWVGRDGAIGSAGGTGAGGGGGGGSGGCDTGTDSYGAGGGGGGAGGCGAPAGGGGGKGGGGSFGLFGIDSVLVVESCTFQLGGGAAGGWGAGGEIGQPGGRGDRGGLAAGGSPAGGAGGWGGSGGASGGGGGGAGGAVAGIFRSGGSLSESLSSFAGGSAGAGGPGGPSPGGAGTAGAPGPVSNILTCAAPGGC